MIYWVGEFHRLGHIGVDVAPQGREAIRSPPHGLGKSKRPSAAVTGLIWADRRSQLGDLENAEVITCLAWFHMCLRRAPFQFFQRCRVTVCWNFLSVFPDENRALFRQVSLDPLEPSSPSPGNPEKPSSPVTWLDSVQNIIQYDTQKYTKHPSRASVHLHSFYIFWYMHQCVGRHNITEAYWSALVGAKRVRLLRIH
jgi:hypothetical protein